ncbi:MAG: hypothetical protein H6751_11920 [Candidatus Omnitrophica bacterium]|nr:hypothetical protein [Candidatus Omnitrophota bacterium]
MTSEYKVSKRLEEILAIKREIAEEVEHLPPKEAIEELRRQASESRKNYPNLKEASPRKKRG